MSINFTARLADNTTISQRVSMFKHNNIPASIVELDNKSIDDMEALHKTADSWYANGGRFAPNIYNRAVSPYPYTDVVKSHYYALTTQKKNFEKLEPDKVLGLMMFSETKDFENELDYLEVNPSTSRSKNRVREYKNVGARLVEFVKRAFREKDIFVQSDARVIKFYKKLGFEQPFHRFPQKCSLYLRR